MRNRIIMSDLHGHFDEFVELLDICEYDINKDQLIILGDICDRGTQSKELFEKISSMQKIGNVIMLSGNHEKMIQAYLEYGDMSYSYNGGANTLISFENDVDDFVRWIKKLPLIHEDENFIYVHAGINLDYPMHEQTEDDLLWIREDWVFRPNTLKKTVIFGHSPVQWITNNNLQKEPLFYDNKICVDTGGCFDNGRFTALIIDKDNNITYKQVEGKR